MTHRQPYKWKEVMDPTPKKPKKKRWPKKPKDWDKKCQASLDKLFGPEKIGKRVGFTNLGF